MKRSTIISLRVSLEFLDQMEQAVKEEKFQSISEAIRTYAEVGLRTEKFKMTITDPEFLKSIDELKQNDGIFNWLETLTDSQADAIASAIQLEKEQRYAKRRYR